MTEANKPRRPYRSPFRDAQARETRERVLAAAEELFIARGYSGATIGAIARRAHVSSETVYSVFGSKRGLLSRLVNAAVLGADSEGSLIRGRGPREVHRARTQQDLLRRFAHDIAWRLDRVGPLMQVVVAAAPGEPEIGELLARIDQARFRNLRIMVGWLAELGPLRMSVDSATETAWSLASPEVYGLLCRRRGWTREEFEAWLAESLRRLLLVSR